MEPIAKKEYVHQNEKKHKDFMVEECGLFLHDKYQYLGASPDLIISCSCCGKGVVEIKCPLIASCHKCNPKLCDCDENQSKLNYLVKSNGKFCLKSNHAYYGQIQGQMAVTGHNYCDFFIYSPFAAHQERILFDSKYWEDMLTNLNFFFNKFMVPYLLTNTIDGPTDRIVEPMEVDSVVPSATTVTGGVFFCPICNERVKEQENILSFGDRSICCDSCNTWCHFKCVKINKTMLKSLKTWTCPSCV